VSVDGALALLSGWKNFDFGAHPLRTPLDGLEASSVRSSLEYYARTEPVPIRTVWDLADWVGIGDIGSLFVGGPSTVADLLEEWVE
jgi:hypothetical protein